MSWFHSLWKEKESFPSLPENFVLSFLSSSSTFFIKFVLFFSFHFSFILCVFSKLFKSNIHTHTHTLNVDMERKKIARPLNKNKNVLDLNQCRCVPTLRPLLSHWKERQKNSRHNHLFYFILLISFSFFFYFNSFCWWQTFSIWPQGASNQHHFERPADWQMESERERDNCTRRRINFLWKRVINTFICC